MIEALFSSGGLIAVLATAVAALIAALVRSSRKHGETSAKLDEADRMRRRNEEQAEKVQEAVRERIRHEEAARTTPIADVDAHPSMRGRQRD